MAERSKTADVAKLQKLMEANGWTVEMLADKAGISKRNADGAVAGEPKTFSTLRSIAAALKTPLKSILPDGDSGEYSTITIQTPDGKASTLTYALAFLKGLSVMRSKVAIQGVDDTKILMAVNMVDVTIKMSEADIARLLTVLLKLKSPEETEGLWNGLRMDISNDFRKAGCILGIEIDGEQFTNF